MDLIPWQALTAAGGGWALFGFGGFLLMTGRLLPKSVVAAIVDAVTRRAEAAERERDALISQNAELMEMARLAQNMYRALEEGAKKA